LRSFVAGSTSSTIRCWLTSATPPSFSSSTEDFGIGLSFEKPHDLVLANHSSYALIKRGLVGIYHNVSREYLHRYLWQFDFLWNNRKLNDGERTILAVKAAEGKRLMYKDPLAEHEGYSIRESRKRWLALKLNMGDAPPGSNAEHAHGRCTNDHEFESDVFNRLRKEVPGIQYKFQNQSPEAISTVVS